MRWLKRANSVFDHTLNLSSIIVFVMIVFVTLSISYEVVLRYFFNGSLIWFVDVNSTLLLYISLLAGGWVLREEGHVNVDIVTSRLNPKVNFILNIITSILAAIFLFILLWVSAKYTVTSYQQGLYALKVIKIPIYIIIMSVPLGSFLLIIEFLRRAYRYFKRLQEHNTAQETPNLSTT